MNIEVVEDTIIAYIEPVLDELSQEEQDRLTQREKEWKEAEDLVMGYQKQFTLIEGFIIPEEDLQLSKDSAQELLKRFTPLFKKYLLLLKNGQIDFNDPEMKLFVCSFIDDPQLQRALKRTKQKGDFRADIYKRFNFIKETYGSTQDEEIMMDLQCLFLVLAKRYKQVGKSFCGYLYNSYRHEVSRHIKKFIKNPLNISYKNVEYEDCINGNSDDKIDDQYEDNYYEDSTGLPDTGWLTGANCSEVFAGLAIIDRKILVKYYLEEWNDRQISEEFGIHINTVNQKRRFAVQKVAENLSINACDIKRNRRSGKKAILPMS